MYVDAHTHQLGTRWLFCSGAFALLFAFFLYTMDNNLSSVDESKGESTLRELRSAQTALGGRASDTRQTQSTVFELRTVPASEAQVDHGHPEEEEHH